MFRILLPVIFISFFISLGILVRNTIEPRIVIPDFSSYTDTNKKKSAFFEFFYPLVLTENKNILQDRNALKRLTSRQSHLPRKSIKNFLRICNKYRSDCKSNQVNTQLAHLLQQVDLIPPSLALAQAANESAWGTSRFAVKAHNYYGQWCFSKGCGLTPSRRNAGATHEVRRFGSPQQSIASYMRNLNTSKAYTQLRQIRSELRKAGSKITGIPLTVGLSRYSERGDAYVKEIQAMIRYNKLIRYDQKMYTQLQHLI